MGFFLHTVSLILILFFTMSFYYNYEFYNNVSYNVASTHLLNVYNHACDVDPKGALYVVVKSSDYVDNKTINGDLLTGKIGMTPVIAPLSACTLSSTQYYLFTRVHVIEDQYGFIVDNCEKKSKASYVYDEIISTLVTVIVFLGILILYMVLNRVWLCFALCTSTSGSGYEELN